MTGPLLLVRADADTQTGTGHVMRTLALAQHWLRAGGRARYVAARMPAALIDRLAAEGMACDLTDNTSGSSDDARYLVEHAQSMDAAAIVVDGYAFGDEFRRIIACCRARSLLVHDYDMTGPLWLDYLLNQNPHASPALYPAVEPARTLLGLQFAMLRTEFVDAGTRADTAPARETRVLVTMGGGDEHNVTARVLEGLELVEQDLTVTVLVGASNPHVELLRRQADAAPYSVQVLSDADDVPGLMRAHDVAVSAAGSTSWELAFLGVPWAAVALADNQRPIQAELERRGMALNLGWWQDLTAQRTADVVGNLIGDRAARTAMAARGCAAVDGRGAARVTALLMGQG